MNNKIPPTKNTRTYAIVRSCLNICIILVFAACASFLLASEVEISEFDTVGQNVSKEIVIFIDPVSAIEKVDLHLFATQGKGQAVFLPESHSSTSISQTSILRITGNEPSSVRSNMILEAKIGEVVLESNVFTVVESVPDAATPPIKTRDRDKMITRSQAIEVASVHLKGKMQIQKNAPITIEQKGSDYIVTFGWIHPQGDRTLMFSPDYTAKVTLDAYTGAAKQILGAP